MARPVAKLYTSKPEFEGLHVALDRSRESSATITISREAFAHLLLDHAELVRFARNHGELKEGVD